MSTVSPRNFISQRMVVCVLMTLWLVGCTNNATPSAPISSIDNDGGNTLSNNIPTINSQNKNKHNAGYSNPLVVSPPPNIVAPPNSAGHAVASNTSTQNITKNGISGDSDSNYLAYNRSYNTIPKGSYNGKTYIAKRGDTLFYIAWITGNDYRDLASRNNISEPYSLHVGQVIKLENNTNENHNNDGMLVANNSSPKVIQKTSPMVDSPPISAYSTTSGKQSVGKMLPSAGAVTATTSGNMGSVSGVATEGSTAAVKNWKWPTKGKIIDNFSTADGGNKGIDIVGSRGQSIFATAEGRVVYAGNALRGYGNLIIIKHNDDYLSAYAHNDTMLVREQQEVKVGQKIATMGSTGTSSVRLHFEIRYKGKSVNPLRYLPQR